MNRPWFPFYVGDYTRDTARLTTEAHGAYLLLILDYWVNGPPPDDNDTLATITKLPVTIWRKRRAAILPFFKVVEGRWTHSRIDREIAAANEKHQKRVEAGKEGGKAKAKSKQTASNARSENIAKTYQSQSPSQSDSSLREGEERPPAKVSIDFVASEAARETIRGMGFGDLQFNNEFSKFIQYYMARGYLRDDWNAALVSWFQRAVPELVAAATVGLTMLNKVFVIFDTLGWKSWVAHLKETRGLTWSRTIERRDEETGRVQQGWWWPTEYAPGYDEATGEHIAPQDEENAA